MDVSSIPRALWFQHAAFVMRDGFEMSRPALLSMLKCLVDQPFHIRQGVHMRRTQSKNYEGGTCYGTHSLQPDLPNFHSAYNWHGLRYQNKDSKNIHVGERQIMEDDPRATVCLGWGGKNTTQTELYIPHQSITATSNISSFRLWC